MEQVALVTSDGVGIKEPVKLVVTVVSGGYALQTSSPPAASTALTSMTTAKPAVSAAVSSGQATVMLSANANRGAATIKNIGTASFDIGKDNTLVYGGGFQLDPGESYNVDANGKYTGAVYAGCASGTSGSATTIELTS